MAAALPRSLTIVRAVIVGRDIIDYAKTHAIDLIAIGTHGYTELSHLLLGSVAEPSGVSPMALTLLIRWWIKSVSPSLVPRSEVVRGLPPPTNLTSDERPRSKT